jgi:hypothetical protein
MRLSRRDRTSRSGDAWRNDTGPICVLCTGKSRSCVALRFHRSIPGTRVLARLEMLLGARDGGLRRIIIRGGYFRRARHPGSRDGLPCIAHFLHRGASAAG